MTKSTAIPLAKPCLSSDDIKAVIKVLESGQFISGPVVESFEQKLASYVGVPYAACVSSGTAALHLGLMALGIERGDEVIVPAFGYPATANAVALVDARPVFVDSAEDGFNIDVSAIENTITSRTKTIMVVHNFGWPVDVGKIKAVSAKYDIPIFEDSACALGSSTSGVRCGSMGRLAAFSFHPRKILTTGEGGALLTNDRALWEKATELRNHGQPAGKSGNFMCAGFNYRLTEFQAALGISQMKRLESTLAKRRSAAQYYAERLTSLDWLKVPKPAGKQEPNFQTYVVSVKGDNRDGLIEHLKVRGISAGIGTYSIPHIHFYQQKHGYSRLDFRNSWRSFCSLISLPLYDDIARQEQDRVISAIESFVPRRKRRASQKLQPVPSASNRRRPQAAAGPAAFTRTKQKGEDV